MQTLKLNVGLIIFVMVMVAACAGLTATITAPCSIVEVGCSQAAQLLEQHYAALTEREGVEVLRLDVKQEDVHPYGVVALREDQDGRALTVVYRVHFLAGEDDTWTITSIKRLSATPE